MEGLGKRTYYKNRWFWYAGILLTAIILLTSPAPKTVDTSVTGMITTPQIIKPGTYKVGEDIKAGEYILVSDKAISAKVIRRSWILNSETYQTKGFTREAIILEYNHYLTVETDNCMIYPAESAPKADIKEGRLNPGVYLVGVDIPEGVYNLYNYSYVDMEIIDLSSVNLYSPSRYSFSGKTQVSLLDEDASLVHGGIIYIPKDTVIITPYSNISEPRSIVYDYKKYYKVGEGGIKPGEYVLVADGIYSNVVSLESAKGSQDSFDVYSRSYLTLAIGQSVNFDYGCSVYTLKNAPKVEVIDGKLPEGMYKAGVDIPEGAYTLVSKTNEQGKYYIANDSKHLNTKYNNFEGSLSVNVKTGQYLYVENGYILVN